MLTLKLDKPAKRKTAMPPSDRRKFLHILRGLGAGAVMSGMALMLLPVAPAAAEESQVTVFKSPYCGCCAKWVDHMRAAGFTVAVRDMEDLTSVKKMAGVPAELESCHTASVGGYIIEGHVPPEAVRRLLSGETGYRGLAVPGMPSGSPGMEGGTPEPYVVYGFDASGRAEPVMSVPAR